MISRVLALAFGVSGAAALSQFPEFAQQYLQRLAGKVDQLEVQVAEIDASAARFSMTRAEYLDDLSQSQTGAAAAEKAMGEIALYTRLSANISDFRAAGALARLAGFTQVADVDLAPRTLADYQPAMPLTAEGAGFGALGFAAGWGIWSVLRGVLGWPFRRRRARQRKEDLKELAEHRARLRREALGVDDDDADEPFIEYEGDINHAMTQQIPALTLPAQDGTVVDLSTLSAPIVIFTFPLMGRPGQAYPEGWEEVDQADAATAMACSFRDSYDMVRQAGIEDVFGISAQSQVDHREAVHRLALPYNLLSDPEMRFAFALDLPSFILNHRRYVAPAILIAQGGRILAALHPVRHAPTAAPRVLRELAQARLAHQRAQIG